MLKILLILTVFITSLFSATLNDKIDFMRDEKKLLILTQELRGKTNMYAKGGFVGLGSTDDEIEEISTTFRRIHRSSDIVGMKIDNEFSMIDLYMKDLNELAAELDPMTTFKAYSLLIREMLRLERETQDAFFHNDTQMHKKISAVMMKQILPLTEHLGKLRGLGSGVAAHRLCNDEEHHYLQETMANTLDDLDAFVVEMNALRQRYKDHYPDGLKSHLKSYQKKVHDYVDFVDAKLSNENAIDVDSYDFFSHGTSLIEQTLRFYEMNEMILKRAN